MWAFATALLVISISIILFVAVVSTLLAATAYVVGKVSDWFGEGCDDEC